MVEVVAALIRKGDKFMICQRPAHKARGFLWEFVGGKVEPGETKEQALIRECREELAITLSVGDIFMDVIHEYPDITVHLTLFNATIAEGEPQKLEHNDIQWITPSDIPNYEFCPADEEILEKIKSGVKIVNKEINLDTIEEIEVRFKTAVAFAQDYESYCKCHNMIQKYVRSDAICLLDTLTKRYECEINQLTFLFGGPYVIHGVNFDNIPDYQIMDQLIYIGQRIPVYAFTREGEKYLAEKLLKRIGCSGFIF